MKFAILALLSVATAIKLTHKKQNFLAQHMAKQTDEEIFTMIAGEDGVVDFEEAAVAFEIPEEGLDEFRADFDKADTDGNGTINLEEALAVM